MTKIAEHHKPNHPKTINICGIQDARVHCVVLNIRSVPTPLDTQPSNEGPRVRSTTTQLPKKEAAKQQARSLRTQQRAHQNPTQHQPFQPPKRRTKPASR
ncbi:hypothetical protein ACFPRL_14485 [Pseudoclavibacter helvolus]